MPARIGSAAFDSSFSQSRNLLIRALVCFNSLLDSSNEPVLITALGADSSSLHLRGGNAHMDGRDLLNALPLI